MRLNDYIHQELAKPDKEILLMTHIVLGYPSLEINGQVIAAMVENGVELIEMQIPFSEPMADGPAIVKANQEAIEQGIKVKECLSFAKEMTAKHHISFLFMTYFNIILQYGVEDFCKDAKEIGIKGFIIPDLPPEEGHDFFTLVRSHGIDPILIYAPTSTPDRMAQLNDSASGFIYCVARKGVTGQKTNLDHDFASYIKRCRQATSLPLAVGFGIADHNDVSQLRGKADIAVIGTKTIKLVNEQGPESVGPFIAGLR